MCNACSRDFATYPRNFKYYEIIYNRENPEYCGNDYRHYIGSTPLCKKCYNCYKWNKGGEGTCDYCMEDYKYTTCDACTNEGAYCSIVSCGCEPYEREYRKIYYDTHTNTRCYFISNDTQCCYCNEVIDVGDDIEVNDDDNNIDGNNN